jgi:hypothetical protein
MIHLLMKNMEQFLLSIKRKIQQNLSRSNQPFYPSLPLIMPLSKKERNSNNPKLNFPKD